MVVPGVSDLLRVVAGTVVLLVAIALNGGAASASGRYPTWRSAHHAIVAAEATDACLADKCGAGGPGGDHCGSQCWCGGHGPCCSGGVVAPASADLIAPSLSSDRLIAYATAMTGVSWPPEKRPPRFI